MARNDDFTIALKNANPIDVVINSYVQLKKRGRTFVCCCPFHSEKTPSFTVYTDTQSFYCFGCGAGGDVFTFIMKAENLEFHDAMRLLAERCGMQVPEADPRSAEKAKRRTRIYEMNRLSANFFFKTLVGPNGRPGLDYFKQRQLTPQTIKKYGLGYADSSWNSLCDHLISQGYSEDEIIDAWLGGRSQNGRIFDMFRNRVMFPIVDLRGNIIGFGGRVLDDSKPKYLNTSKTPVFDKGSNLFSMNFAKNSNSRRLILCEGYMDVIAVNQAGFDNVVATLGTAITPDQARLISHHADEVIIAYDSDSAGQAASRKAISHFSDVGVQTKVLKMEGAKDPDEYIKKFGSQRFAMLIEKSDDANNFLLDKCENGLDIDSESDKVVLLKRLSRVLADIPSALEREVYISRTAKKYDFPTDVLKSHIDSMIRKNNYNEKNDQWRSIKTQTTIARDDINPDAVQFKKESRAEEMIICLLLRQPEDAKKFRELAPPDIFVTEFNKRVYSALLDTAENSENFSLSFISDGFSVGEMERIYGIQAKNRDIDISFDSVKGCAEILRKTVIKKSPENISDDDLNNLFFNKKS